MAYWCHAVASPPQNPGVVEKWHFRKDEIKGLEEDFDGKNDQISPSK